MNFNAPIVSPIATNALNYYRYKLEGVFYENSKLINKIQVIPRRPKDNVWKGYLYIVEDDWQLYGVDLNTTGMRFKFLLSMNCSSNKTFSMIRNSSVGKNFTDHRFQV